MRALSTLNTLIAFILMQVIDKLKEVFSVKSDRALAKAMGVAPTTVNSWRQRQSIPYAECVRIAVEKKLDLNWLLTGEGSMDRVQEEPAEYKGREGPDLDGKINAMLHGMDDDMKQDVLKYAEDKKLLKQIREERKQKTG